MQATGPLPRGLQYLKAEMSLLWVKGISPLRPLLTILGSIDVEQVSEAKKSNRQPNLIQSLLFHVHGILKPETLEDEEQSWDLTVDEVSGKH